MKIAADFEGKLQTPIFMPGWGDAFKVKTLRNSLVTVGSATPAIFMSILLFILPQVALKLSCFSFIFKLFQSI